MAYWIDTFIDEKGVDREELIMVEGESGLNMMNVQVVVDAIKNTGKREQDQIKKTLVMIDFKNGDVVHYLKHLAQALAV